MATVKVTSHTRSVSLPSEPTTLAVRSIEDQLSSLQVSQGRHSSSSSICQNLCIIKDLYQKMNSSFDLPHNQHFLSSYDLHRLQVEEVVDGSLSLLEISSSAFDVLSEMKESILYLESALRRGCCSEGISDYLVSKKKINKTLCKCLVNLKKAEKIFPTRDSGCNTLYLLKEAESVSLSTMKSLLLYLMGKNALFHDHGRWSFVAKLVRSKHDLREIDNVSDIKDLDRVLCALSNKSLSSDSKILLKQIETIEMIISELHDVMDSVSRCFIKTRVSLLNVLN